MGFLDRLTGTKHPDRGVEPRSAEGVRAALLGLNGPEVPYVVRTATSAEGADLVAEWRLREPAWHPYFARTQLDRTLRIRMRLLPAARELRALDEQWKVTWTGGTPTLVLEREYSRGQVAESSREWTIGRGADGRPGVTEVSRFDAAALKHPLREAVLAAGWTWRGAVFKL
ncbi:hypothetical protein [Kitasatospora sp. NPDC090091]|uniref:hypothetical protein n=1 Tax=Kitasatospora sp. NPDC090091 TaxID=3364081 RepID=UPI0038107E47